MVNELLRQKRIHGLPEIITDEERILLDKGMPIQKIIGFINFDDVQINVNRNVLIPRYETEELVRKVISFVDSNSSVLDLCSGSGYIGLSINKKTGANVTLSDYYDDPILQAKENAKLNNLDVNIIQSNMFENINDKFDVIVSNPPYIPKDIALDNSVLNFEPHNALFAGEDGNDFYRIIINEGPKYLKYNGIIFLEISNDNKKYLESNGYEIENDINGKPRIAWRRY